MTARNITAIVLLALLLALPFYLATTQTTVSKSTQVVVDGTVSEATWQKLLRSGWAGDPDDGLEALYPPAPLSDDHADNLRHSVASGCALYGQVFEDLSCKPYPGSGV